MQLLWKQFRRHLDIALWAVGSLFLAGMAWANINNKLTQHEQELAAISTWQTQQIQQTNSIQQSAARTEQELSDIAENVQDIKQWLRDKR